MGESLFRTEKINNGTQRNGSLDILRTLCMFLIVLGHSICHGQVLDAVTTNSVNYFLVTAIYTFLMVHVNCFVLISGYFLCMHKFRLQKAISLWIQAFFWSALLYVILSVFGIIPFGIKDFIKALLPFTQQRYWFVTSYLLMYFLTPFLNAAIHSMTRKQHATFLVTYFVIYIALQNLVFWREFTSVNSSSPLFFAFLYMVAAYIRLYPPHQKHRWLLLYISACAFVAIWKYVITWITTSVFGKAVGASAFSAYNSITMVLASVFLFLFFEELTIRNQKVCEIASKLSSLTFGIYLIHDQPEVRTFIWQELICPDRFAQSPVLVLLLLGLAILVFSCSAILEALRQKLFSVLSIDRIPAVVAERTEYCARGVINRVFDNEGN